MENIHRPLNEETRHFPPPEHFSQSAAINSVEEYQRLYNYSIENNTQFWDEVARQLHWNKPWDQVLNEQNKPFFEWFVGGQTNICYNCLDRHLEQNRDKVAIVFEDEFGESYSLTYKQLHDEVCKFTNTLIDLGIQLGDRVAIYMGMTPEIVVAVLACARMGAVHNVIFGGFANDSIRGRIQDCEAKMVITSDIGYRRGNTLQLKHAVDQAVAECPSIQKILVVQRTPKHDKSLTPMQPGRDFWYDEASQLRSNAHIAQPMDSEQMLFLLYTSGTTGAPKGIVHTTGGYMVGTYLTTKYVFDIKPQDVYWCTADIGWITGHSYVIYGPLLNCATILLYEGAPNFPNEGRFWDIIEKHRVTIFYTAPTAIRTFMRWGDRWPQGKDLSSLRLLGSVGEPINPEAWMWYYTVIGQQKCPIVDTWWQTETGAIMLTPIPGVTVCKPGSCTFPFFGIEPTILTEEGQETEYGYLAIKKPWPSMMRGIYNNSARYINGYWSMWNGNYYYPADGALKDQEGYFWIIGRLDDIVNVSGHRISTAELEATVITHSKVAESAFVGIPHEIKGQCLIAFVILKQEFQGDNQLKQELNQIIGEKLGRFQLPEKIVFVPELPKTRSGKIMRRLLRDICNNEASGNTATLADSSIIEVIKGCYENS